MYLIKKFEFLTTYYFYNYFNLFIYIFNLNLFKSIDYLYQSFLRFSFTKNKTTFDSILSGLLLKLTLGFKLKRILFKRELKKKKTELKPNLTNNLYFNKESSKLRIRFTHRNTFFTISDSKENILKTTSIRREGFYGRRRKTFTSLLTAMRSIKKSLRFLKIIKLDLIIIGWSKYRYAIRKALKDNLTWLSENNLKSINYNYIIYKLKIPHNGCRLSKAKNRKRLKWKRFFKSSIKKVYKQKKKSLIKFTSSKKVFKNYNFYLSKKLILFSKSSKLFSQVLDLNYLKLDLLIVVNELLLKKNNLLFLFNLNLILNNSISIKKIKYWKKKYIKLYKKNKCIQDKLKFNLLSIYSK